MTTLSVHHSRFIALSFACSLGFSPIFGCAGGEAGDIVASETEVGSLKLGLTLSANTVIDEATYQITGNGLKKEGTLDISDTQVVRARIGGIPAGTGYRIALQASATDGRTSAGSATFDIAGGAVTNVQVNLRWAGAQRNGSVVINGAFNECPVIDELSVTPLTVTVPGPVQLTARASDDGLPSALTYRWTAANGALVANDTSQGATLTSQAAGNRNVTITVSDGDCTTTASAQVTFVAAPPVAGSGAAGASGAGGTGGAAGGGSTPQHNILLLIQDDYGAEASSLYPDLNGDSGVVAQPNIEALAEQGLVFDNAWSNPACSMTRGTIISGLYGHRTGVTFVGAVLPPDTTTLFDQLNAQDKYDSALFGKYHVGTTIEHPTQIGLKTFKGFLGGAISDYYNWTALDVNGPAVLWSTYSTTVITDFAVDYINQHEAEHPDRPWFVYQAYNGSHAPFQVPPRNLHTLDVGGQAPSTVDNSINNYKAIIQATDTEIGRLLAEVDLDETTVIFIGDNGTPGAQKDTGTGVRGSKGSAFEGGVRVPFVIAGYGVTRRGREDALVNTADLFTTIQELAGLSAPHVNNSYSLKPLLTDENATTGRTHNFTEYCSGENTQHYAIRDARYKLVSSNKVYTLYDLASDPLESTDLFNNPQYAAQRSSLLAEIATLKASATAGCLQ